MQCPECGKKMKMKRGPYKYTESGLRRSVDLLNVEIWECSCGQRSVGIPKIEKLHELIADGIIHQKAPLDGAEVRFLRKQMEMSQVVFAKLLGVSNVTVSRWEGGDEKIGLQSDRLVRLLYVQRVQEKCKQVFPFMDTIGEIKASAKATRISITLPVENSEAVVC